MTPIDDETRRDAAAIERLLRLSRQHGLDLRGGDVLRTSSRFCLAVEHGDYNGTALFGVGTDRFLWLGHRDNGRRTLRFSSAEFAAEGVVEVDPAAVPPPGALAGWGRYARGAVAVLQREGFALRRGLDLALTSDIPGGGMSRSASLCVNLVTTLLSANGHAEQAPLRLAALARAIENDYVGSPCGVLDPTMIACARAGHGTLFEPGSRRIEHVPLGSAAPDFRFVALDTGTVRMGLEHSTYARRRAECAELLHLANAAGFGLPDLAAVRDETAMQALRRRFGDSHPHLLLRLEYLFAAGQRFPELLAAWRRGDIARVGAIFRQDGLGLRDHYRISGPQLETMCDLARTVPGVFGERMLGGGDCGAAGALVAVAALPELRRAVATGYPRSHPEFAARHAVHELRTVDGVRWLRRAL